MTDTRSPRGELARLVAISDIKISQTQLALPHYEARCDSEDGRQASQVSVLLTSCPTHLVVISMFG